jgi:hypothetical protein
LDARKSTAVEITFPDTNKLQPDHYSGTMRFSLNGYDTEPTFNYTLDVRDGPWFALLVLLIGIIVGRLIKSMNSPEATAELKLLERCYRLQNKTYSLSDTKDRDVLLAELDKIKQRINAGDESEAVLTPELDKIQSRINLFIELEQLGPRIGALENPALKQELLAKRLEARQSLRQGKIEDCLASIKAIETKLLEAEAAAPKDARSESFVRVLDSVRGLAEEGVKAVKAHQVVPPAKPRNYTRVLAWLSGVNLQNAEVRYWVFRPLLFLLVLLLLALAGLKALYIDGSASFGSGGLYDYLGLFMWGLSAQMVQSSLQNLRLPGAGA